MSEFAEKIEQLQRDKEQRLRRMIAETAPTHTPADVEPEDICAWAAAEIENLGAATPADRALAFLARWENNFKRDADPGTRLFIAEMPTASEYCSRRTGIRKLADGQTRFTYSASESKSVRAMTSRLDPSVEQSVYVLTEFYDTADKVLERTVTRLDGSENTLAFFWLADQGAFGMTWVE